MIVKGTAFLARQVQLSEQFGQERWDQFLAVLAEEHHYFGDAIFATSKIPLDVFLSFQDALVEHFFDGDVAAHRQMGERAAEWALTRGPIEGVLERPDDYGTFIAETTKRVWQRYFDFGRIEARLADDRIEIVITALPQAHPYFEISFVGYLLKTLELIGAREPRCEVEPTTADGTLTFHFTTGGWQPR